MRKKTDAPAWKKFEQRGLKERGDNWDTICPSHKDDKKSLSLSIADDGKIVLRCFAGCPVITIVESLGLRMQDLWEPNEASTKEHIERRATLKVVAEYNYVDEEGKLLYQVQRTEPKGFFQRRYCGNGSWETKLGDVRRVLYRLPEVIACTKPILLVEGEKDVDNLRGLGLTATTVSGGSVGWRPDFAKFFEGKPVVILPDNDEPGNEYAVTAMTWIRNALLIRLPGLPEKGDVSDWIAAGGTAKDLGDMVRHAASARFVASYEFLKAVGG